MRIWSLSPSYLDASGIVALWREALLARKVLLGQTKGYTRHPQLIRFRESSSPLDAINAYLQEVYEEAKRRGYAFDFRKLEAEIPSNLSIPVTRGQLAYEWAHLLHKLETRSPEQYQYLHSIPLPKTHPLFRIVPGNISPWEKTS